MEVLPPWLSLDGHDPVVHGALVLLGAFILEDAATALAALDIELGPAALRVAIASLYVAIFLSDLALYGLGRLAVATPWARRWAPPERFARHGEWLRTHLVKAVLVSRFTPGARLPAYTACGYVRASLRRFALASIAGTLIWTTLLLAISLHLGHSAAEQLGAWQWAVIAGVALTVTAAGRLATRLQRGAP